MTGIQNRSFLAFESNFKNLKLLIDLTNINSLIQTNTNKTSDRYAQSNKEFLFCFGVVRPIARSYTVCARMSGRFVLCFHLRPNLYTSLLGFGEVPLGFVAASQKWFDYFLRLRCLISYRDFWYCMPILIGGRVDLSMVVNSAEFTLRPRESIGFLWFC